MTRFDPVDAGGLQIARRNRLRCSSANSPTAAKVARNWRTGSSGLGNNDGHDAHRHSGTPRRQDRRLDGEGHRRTIPRLIKHREEVVILAWRKTTEDEVTAGQPRVSRCPDRSSWSSPYRWADRTGSGTG